MAESKTWDTQTVAQHSGIEPETVPAQAVGRNTALNTAAELDELEELEPAEHIEELYMAELEELELVGLGTEEKKEVPLLSFGSPKKNVATAPAHTLGFINKGVELGSLEEIGLAEQAAGGNLVREPLTDQKINAFVPNEFIRLLGKKSVQELSLGHHIRREMTVFVSDIRRFTEIL